MQVQQNHIHAHIHPVELTQCLKKQTEKSGIERVYGSLLSLKISHSSVIYL